MQPRELTSASFSTYPPQARRFAIAHLAMLRTLPLVFAPLLLREWIGYDWRLPAERKLLETQVAALSSLSPAGRAELFAGFNSLTLSPDLIRADWVAYPGSFMEMLTAFLWSSHQMDRFRLVATNYQAAIDLMRPPAKPRQPRLGMVAIGAGAEHASEPIFSKLKPYGTHFTAIQSAHGWDALESHARERAGSDPDPPKFRHWLISGFGLGDPHPGLVQVSYADLQSVRLALLELIERALHAGNMGAEEMRSLLARLNPKDVGLSDAGEDGVLNRFQLSLLTEGSGTQIFSTTFVQWAARECIRRADPETVLLRFSPRQQARSMNEMLTQMVPAALAPAESLVDADMAAYYTWIELKRLSGSEDVRFLVWYESHQEALLIGPGLPRGTASDSQLNMTELLKLLA